MRELSLKMAGSIKKEHTLLGALLLLWGLSPNMIQLLDHTAGLIDQSIWMLVLLAVISFLMMTGLAWWLLQRFWTAMKLPARSRMFAQFNTLELWQQLSFYFASFALLLLAATGALVAVL
ncbi:hypothetical protein [Pedobacter faecalis]|uniref:hypothetical protein n=1 Tax=Pedobacter faecalis TaxID=3041495 RepID=UPI002550F6BD|nr:hypothetical protein [Pedobacter sp. ELA7]